MLNMTLLHQNKICCNWFIIHYHLFFFTQMSQTCCLMAMGSYYATDCQYHSHCHCTPRSTLFPQLQYLLPMSMRSALIHYILVSKILKNACLSLTPYKHWWICVCNSFVSWCDTQGFRYFYCHCGNNWYLILHWLFI